MSLLLLFAGSSRRAVSRVTGGGIPRGKTGRVEYESWKRAREADRRRRAEFKQLEEALRLELEAAYDRVNPRPVAAVASELAVAQPVMYPPVNPAGALAALSQPVAPMRPAMRSTEAVDLEVLLLAA